MIIWIAQNAGVMDFPSDGVYGLPLGLLHNFISYLGSLRGQLILAKY
jgi:hypothetical protein